MGNGEDTGDKAEGNKRLNTNEHQDSPDEADVMLNAPHTTTNSAELLHEESIAPNSYATNARKNKSHISKKARWVVLVVILLLVCWLLIYLAGPFGASSTTELNNVYDKLSSHLVPPFQEDYHDIVSDGSSCSVIYRLWTMGDVSCRPVTLKALLLATKDGVFDRRKIISAMSDEKFVIQSEFSKKFISGEIYRSSSVRGWNTNYVITETDYSHYTSGVGYAKHVKYYYNIVGKQDSITVSVEYVKYSNENIGQASITITATDKK